MEFHCNPVDEVERFTFEREADTVKEKMPGWIYYWFAVEIWNRYGILSYSTTRFKDGRIAGFLITGATYIYVARCLMIKSGCDTVRMRILCMVIAAGIILASRMAACLLYDARRREEDHSTGIGEETDEILDTWNELFGRDRADALEDKIKAVELYEKNKKMIEKTRWNFLFLFGDAAVLLHLFIWLYR